MGTLVRPRMGILTCRTPHELITSIWWISQGFAGTIYRKPSFLKLHNVNMALINPPTIKYANSRFKIINPPRNKVRQLFFPVFFRFFPLVFVFLFGKVSKKKKVGIIWWMCFQHRRSPTNQKNTHCNQSQPPCREH